MLRISGPCYVSVFKMNEQKVIVFGDLHYSKEQACTNCSKKTNCLNIVEFLDSLDDNSHILLEAPYLTKEEKSSYQQYINKPSKDWLSEVTWHFKKHLYKITTKKHSKRVHYIDIRKHRSLQALYILSHIIDIKSSLNDDNLLMEIMVGILQDFKNKMFIKRFIDVFVKHNDYMQEMQKLFKERAHIYSDNTSLTKYTKYKDITGIHRIRKQVLKLTPVYQKALLKYHNDVCNDLLNDVYTYEYNKIRRQILKNKDHTKLFDIQYMFQKWMVHLMDIYTIARLLFLQTTGSRNTIVSYTGAYHAYSYSFFLKSYLPQDVVQEWEYNAEQNNNNQQKRCVLLPISFHSSQ